MTMSDFLCDINPFCAVPAGITEIGYQLTPSYGQKLIQDSVVRDVQTGSPDEGGSDSGIGTGTVLLIAGAVAITFLLMERRK